MSYKFEVGDVVYVCAEGEPLYKDKVTRVQGNIIGCYSGRKAFIDSGKFFGLGVYGDGSHTALPATPTLDHKYMIFERKDRVIKTMNKLYKRITEAQLLELENTLAKVELK